MDLPSYMYYVRRTMQIENQFMGKNWPSCDTVYLVVKHSV